MGIRVKVSAKNQISMPAEARKRLRIKAGDQLLVDVRDGYVILMPEPRNYNEHLKGLHSEVWEGIDPEEYVKGEREAWQE